jgi:plastocyanin
MVRSDPEADHVYDPADVTVKAGDTVTWTFADDGGVPGGAPVTGHDVVFKSFRSEIIVQGTYSHTFTEEEKGVNEYFCSLHPKMKGTVTVE